MSPRLLLCVACGLAACAFDPLGPASGDGGAPRAFDAGAGDAGAPDAGEAGDAGTCGRESDVAFCERLGLDCGLVSGFDTCGDPRSVNCGACLEGLGCGAAGTANVCGCDESSCTGLRHCAQGRCVDGCDRSDQCGANEACSAANACECEPGFHRCSAACLANGSIASCGSRCDACPAVANADPTCDSRSCGFACRAGSRECAGACAACPAQASAVACDGARCVATACRGDWVPCAEGCCRWVAETVASGGAGNGASIAISGSREPVISHYRRSTGDLLLEVHSPEGLWIGSSIMSSGGGATSTATRGDALAIAAWDSGSNTLFLATKPTTSWLVRRIEQVSGTFVAAALDAAGSVHVTYQDLAHQRLRYARWNGTTMELEFPDDTQTGAYPSIALDPEGQPNLTYLRVTSTGQELRQAWKSGNTWSHRTIRRGDLYGSALAIDSAGVPHVVWTETEGLSDRLWYGRWNAGSWNAVKVDATADVSPRLALQLDSRGRPHVAYADETNADVKYAQLVGSAWAVETVQGTGLFAEPSLAIGRDDTLHVACMETSVGLLRYARREVSP